MDWFLYDIGLRHERVKAISSFYNDVTLYKKLETYHASIPNKSSNTSSPIYFPAFLPLKLLRAAVTSCKKNQINSMHPFVIKLKKKMSRAPFRSKTPVQNFSQKNNLSQF